VNDVEFDDLIRLSAGIEAYRRVLVKVLAGGVMGATLPLADVTESVAKRSKVGGRCGRIGRKRKKGKGRRRQRVTCFPDARCQRGRCRCRAGRRDCTGNGRCDDLASIDHCGACGVTCGPGEGCCDSTCTDIRDNPDHCGACGVRCGDNEGCNDGQCRPFL
jgi:hypothetical protein